MEKKTSIIDRLKAVFLIIAAIFIIFFVLHNCWKIHDEGIEIYNGLIKVDEVTEEKDK